MNTDEGRASVEVSRNLADGIILPRTTPAKSGVMHSTSSMPRERSQSAASSIVATPRTESTAKPMLASGVELVLSFVIASIRMAVLPGISPPAPPRKRGRKPAPSPFVKVDLRTRTGSPANGHPRMLGHWPWTTTRCFAGSRQFPVSNGSAPRSRNGYRSLPASLRERTPTTANAAQHGLSHRTRNPPYAGGGTGARPYPACLREARRACISDRRTCLAEGHDDRIAGRRAGRAVRRGGSRRRPAHAAGKRRRRLPGPLHAAPQGECTAHRRCREGRAP